MSNDGGGDEGGGWVLWCWGLGGSEQIQMSQIWNNVLKGPQLKHTPTVPIHNINRISF